MSAFSIEALLTLFAVPGIGPARMRKLISFFGTPQDVLNASARQLISVEGIEAKTADKIKSAHDTHFVKIQLDKIKKYDAHILTFWDKAYPDRLKRIFDPPVFLFVKGDISLLERHSIGIVGTRVPTSYGKAVTEQLSRELIQNELVIISGFARGVDTIAHHAALNAGGKTIAVLGNGLDIIYPAENKKLLDNFANDGLFISEYPFGTNPDGGNFPKRNRIISGISIGILITEAGAKSGALLTAMYALDQNREVFAVPGAITSGNSSGTNSLIKQGAKLVSGIDDILSELTAYIDINTGKEKPEPKLNKQEKAIYGLLKQEPLHIDQIALKAEISSSEALTTLLTMELSGVVRQMAGKMFTII